MSKSRKVKGFRKDFMIAHARSLLRQGASFWSAVTYLCTKGMCRRHAVREAGALLELQRRK